MRENKENSASEVISFVDADCSSVEFKLDKKTNKICICLHKNQASVGGIEENLTFNLPEDPKAGNVPCEGEGKNKSWDEKLQHNVKVVELRANVTDETTSELEDPKEEEVESWKALVADKEKRIASLENDLERQIQKVINTKAEMRQLTETMERSMNLYKAELQQAREENVLLAEKMAGKEREIFEKNEQLILETETLRTNMDIAMVLLNEKAEGDARMSNDVSVGENEAAKKHLHDQANRFNRTKEEGLKRSLVELEQSKHAAKKELDALVEKTVSAIETDLKDDVRKILEISLKNRCLNLSLTQPENYM